MSKCDEIYRKRECEICGKYAFEKWLGTKAVLDGGFTRVEDFEKSGFGNMVIVPYDLKTFENSRIELKLCPDCAREIDLAISEKIAELKKKCTEENI